MPQPQDICTILAGDNESIHRIQIGSLIGRGDLGVSLKTNMVVARHMAILAMTGGGKTVASRRIIRELLDANYPLVILDPHGDYLGFWEKRQALFAKREPVCRMGKRFSLPSNNIVCVGSSNPSPGHESAIDQSPAHAYLGDRR